MRHRMNPLHRLTLAQLVDHYGAFLVDQFGTLHNGLRLYPGALAALQRMRKRGRVVLLSNSGKRAVANIRRLDRLGIPPDVYDLLLTSGELGWRILRDVWGGARAVLLLSRGEDASFLDGLAMRPVTRAEQADVVVIAGSEGDRFPLTHYATVLQPAAERGLTALCLNPDRTMLVSDGTSFGAGQIAELYQSLGGHVVWIGKPYGELYRAALAEIGEPEPATVVGIGDSMEHDVAGAKGAGCAAALVLTGIASGATAAAIEAECLRWNTRPDAVLHDLQ
jgi:HAD superfamily hydrolase (TIGR01459 family)